MTDTLNRPPSFIANTFKYITISALFLVNVKTSIQGSTKQSAFLKALIFIVYTGNINFPFFSLLRSALEYGQVFLALEQDRT